MNIRKSERELFKKWKNGKNSFVEDGIVDIKKYKRSSIKIIYLLKEVNSNNNFWNLKEYIKNGARGPTWNEITRWTIGIRNINKHINWSQISHINKAKRKKYLNSIGVINIKKEIGGSKSKNKELKIYAKENSNYIKKQIKIYDPDLIICCGTTYYYNNFIEKDTIHWKNSSYGVYYYERNKNKYVIDWKHPQWRVSSNMKYYPLVDSIREIIK